MSTRRRLISIAAVIALTSATLVIGEQSITSASAATTALTTATSRDALAAQIVASHFPGGSPIAVVSQNAVSAVQTAGSIAARKDAPVVVVASGTNGATALSELQAMNTTQVILVASTSATYFTSTFQAALTNAGISILSTHMSSNTWSRMVSAAGTSAPAYALVRDDSGAIPLATAYSASRGIPLLIWQASTSDTSMQSFFNSVPDAELVFFGMNNIPSHLLTAERLADFTTVDTADPARVFAWVAGEAQLYGATANRVVAATASSAEELALAGTVAAKTNGLLAPAGLASAITVNSRATEYLTLWRNGTSSLTLVGLSLTASHLTELAAPTLLTFSSSPAFRVTNFVRSSGTYKLTVSAQPNATSYQAFDMMGNVIATSSTSTLTFSTPATGALIVASGAGGELARLDVHLNYYDATSNMDEVVTVGSSGGTNHVRINSLVGTPRLITRAVNDPFALPPVNGVAVPLAITCASSFTDVTNDPTKEYVYDLIELTNVSVRACSSGYPEAPANVLDGVVVAGVTAPATSFPGARGPAPTASGRTGAQQVVQDALDAVASDAETGGPNDPGIRTPSEPDSNESESEPESPVDPDPTEAGTETLTEDVADSPSVAAGPGDDWPPVTTRWMTYIMEDKVLFPLYSGNPTYPTIWFGGDNHGSQEPNGSARFTQDFDVYFGWAAHLSGYYESMGETRKYHCSIIGNPCVLAATATAPLSQLNGTIVSSGPTSFLGHMTSVAADPLVNPPFGVDHAVHTDVWIRMGQGSSAVWGYHDNFPKHEFYFGLKWSEYYMIYESDYVHGHVWRLPCLLASPQNIVPGCSVYFNQQI